MKFKRLLLFSTICVAAFTQQPKPVPPAHVDDVMVVAVAHENSVLGGGIGSGRNMPVGEVAVAPIAWISPAGNWKPIRCDEDHLADCKVFDTEYLRKPHRYTVVSADGRGSQVDVDKMTLTAFELNPDECFGFGGQGVNTAPAVKYAAIAASSEDMFGPGLPARRIGGHEAESIQSALSFFVPQKLDSTQELRFYSITLEGQNLIVVQRAFQDYASRLEFKPGHSNYKFIFGIGRMGGRGFEFLHWKENIEDDNEQILGLIHLKNGRDYLLTSTVDPETQHFRIYGIQNGTLSIVFETALQGC